jgi:hypothetical protein
MDVLLVLSISLSARYLDFPERYRPSLLVVNLIKGLLLVRALYLV